MRFFQKRGLEIVKYILEKEVISTLKSSDYLAKCIYVALLNPKAPLNSIILRAAAMTTPQPITGCSVELVK